MGKKKTTKLIAQIAAETNLPENHLTKIGRPQKGSKQVGNQVCLGFFLPASYCFKGVLIHGMQYGSTCKEGGLRGQPPSAVGS